MQPLPASERRNGTLYLRWRRPYRDDATFQVVVVLPVSTGDRRQKPQTPVTSVG